MKLKKLAVILVGVIILVLMVAWAFRKSSGTTPLPKNNNEVENPGWKKYESEYLMFEYPEKYQLVKKPTSDGRVYTYAQFVGDETNIKNMTLMFRESTQGLNELPDVKMRRGDTLQYSEEVGRIGEDIRGLLFRTADRKERVAYFIKKGRLLEVVLVSQGPYAEAIESEFRQILNSVVWK